MLIRTIALVAMALIALGASSCSKKKKGADVKLVTQKIDGIGVSVDAPEKWQLKENMPGHYRLKGPGGFVVVKKMSADFKPPTTLEELEKNCGGEVYEKATLPSGALFILCKGTQSDFDTKRVEVVLPLEGGDVAQCFIETTNDPALSAKICKTLAKN